MSRQELWDQRYRGQSPGTARPPRVLAENLHLLPRSGDALDLACGLGAAALLLAERGLRVCAWDFSEVAIERTRQAAAARGVAVDARRRDVLAEPPRPDSW